MSNPPPPTAPPPSSGGSGTTTGAGGAKETDRLLEVRTQLNKVTDVMRDNIDQTIARGAKLDELQTKSDALDESSVRFEKRSRDVKWAMCRQYYRTIAVILVIIAILIIVIYFSVKKSQSN